MIVETLEKIVSVLKNSVSAKILRLKKEILSFILLSISLVTSIILIILGLILFLSRFLDLDIILLLFGILILISFIILNLTQNKRLKEI